MVNQLSLMVKKVYKEMQLFVLVYKIVILINLHSRRIIQKLESSLSVRDNLLCLHK